jgi:hypothetical protein
LRVSYGLAVKLEERLVRWSKRGLPGDLPHQSVQGPRPSGDA